jgi:hypothetical protein
MSTTNTNVATGIRYGVIQGNSVPDLLDDIFTNGDSLTYAAWKRDTIKQIAALLEDEEMTAGDLAEHFHECGAYVGHGKDRDTREAESALEEISDGADATEIATAVVDNLQWDNANFEEEEYEYTDRNGAEYLLSYLGGAPLIWVIKSPHIVYARSLCSPCVPNAADLDSGLTTEEEGYQCYGLSPDDMPIEDSAD